MTVRCAQCDTENRDRAMFCIGCAAKLPAFAATGPSALQALGGAAGRPATRRAPDAGETGWRRASATVSAAPRGLVIAVVLLGITVLALAAWIGFGPLRAAAPTSSPAAPVAASAPAATAPQTAPAPSSQVPVEATLAAGESTVLPPPVKAEPTVLWSTLSPPGSEPPQQPARSAAVAQGPAPAARGAADPRTGCEQMFFVLAARCEARHCEEAAYARHPRCTIVRAQRERDVARRDLSQ